MEGILRFAERILPRAATCAPLDQEQSLECVNSPDWPFDS